MTTCQIDRVHQGSPGAATPGLGGTIRPAIHAGLISWKRAMEPQRQRRFVVYHEAREQIQDGDLLLYRRRGVISAVGRGEHSHAAKAAWWEHDLFCLEVREWYGGRAVTLSSQVRSLSSLEAFTTTRYLSRARR